jgi:K+-transporting ATPase ATPase A chain
MVGRTPEFLGKKIGPPENKMIMLYTLAMPIALLPLTAVAVLTKGGLAGLTINTGAHGFTEIFFGYASSFANNGQSFAGLNANTLFYNVTTAVAMVFGRFALAIPAIALAGLFARQLNSPPSSGTLRTDSLPFGLALTATVLIVAGLSYFPALTLGPILEQLLSK